MMMATISSICTNPPSVYEVTTPSNHNMTNTTAIVVNIDLFYLLISIKNFEHKLCMPM